jgi:alpha-D-ribose 1-methylphosphonate 5-triphosphate diphosphatase
LLGKQPGTRHHAHAGRARRTVLIAAVTTFTGGFPPRSGNVSALQLVREGVLDALSSDYVPSSLLQAAWNLCAEARTTLFAAANVVSLDAVQACGLRNRGHIAPGLRADLVRIREVTGSPVVRRV